MRKENTTISIAKGIGICLVLIGHFTFIKEVRRFIYCFHMPMFFFLSGYLFRDRGISELPRYIWRKVKSLYVPFVFCNVFALFFHNLFCRIGVYEAAEAFTSVRQLLTYIIKIFLCIKMEDIVAPLWFLPILMAVSIAYYMIRNVAKMSGRQEQVTSLIVLLGYAIAYFLTYIGKSTGLWRALILVGIGLCMFHLGHVYGMKEESIRVFWHNKIVVLICLLVEIRLSFIVDINMIQMRFSNPVVFMVCAVLGINIVMYIAEVIRNDEGRIQEVFRFLGNNSLIILEWHYWGALCTTVLQAFINNCFIEGIIFYQGNLRWLWFAGYCITGLGLPLLVLQMRKQLKKCK